MPRFIIKMVFLFTVLFFLVSTYALFMTEFSHPITILLVSAFVGIIVCAIIGMPKIIAYAFGDWYTRMQQLKYHSEKPMMKLDDSRFKDKGYEVYRYYYKCKICGRHPNSRAYHLKYIHDVCTPEEYVLILNYSETSSRICPLKMRQEYDSPVLKYFENCGCGNCVRFYSTETIG